MGGKKAFGLQSLVLCVLFNGLLTAWLYGVAAQALPGIQEDRIPVAGEGVEGAPEPPGGILGYLGTLLQENRNLLAPVVFGSGAFVTLALWLSLLLARGRSPEERPASGRKGAGPVDESLDKEVKRLEKELQAARKAASKPSPAPAVQILSILQRQGRLIDFLEEDLSLYEDGQIGAAVRSIHQGCKEALRQNVGLEPVLGEEEGSKVTIRPGFDPRTVRLTGDVRGDPPFQGILRHRGWRVVRMDLPLKSPDQEPDWILAPAEVEMGE
jgi:hypothetical protein